MESPKYAIVDIETTGQSHSSGDRMIQIAIVIMQDWQIQKTYTKFINPGKPIPSFIQDLTNICDEDVKEANPFEVHADYIYELLSDCVFVAHNTDFDLPFLQAEFRRVGLPKWQGKKIDTVELVKILFPSALSYKLGDIAADLNIELKAAHRADDDAMATALLLKACWDSLLQLPMQTVEALHKRSFRLKTNIANLFFDALFVKRGKKDLSDEWLFYKKIAIQKPVKFEPNWANAHFPSDDEEKRTRFKQVLPNYEERPQQIDMMNIVWDGFMRKQETVIEASTGIGKTLAYLLPAYFYSLKVQKPVIVSTYTSTLMDQLLLEEVAKLEAYLNTNVQVASVKGMNNYIDIDRFVQALNTLDETYDETFATLQVLVWLSKTKTGDLSELNLSGGGQLFIDKIRKNNASTPNPESIDFYEQAIKRTEFAHIIVTNHAMILADKERQTPIFTKTAGYIFDEAHQVVQAAIAKREKVFSFSSWKYTIGQIGLADDKQLFAKLQRFALKKQLVASNVLRKSEKQFLELIQVFDGAMTELSQAIEQYIVKENVQSLKFTAFLEELQFEKSRFFYFTNVCKTWIDQAEQILTSIRQSVDELSTQNEALVRDYHYFMEEIKLKLVEWQEIFVVYNDKEAIWIEADQRSIPGSIQLFKRPLQIDDVIDETFSTLRKEVPIIWTSGTLTVPKNKTFITSQLHVEPTIPIHQLKAPKSYYAGAKTFIVNDMPDIQLVSQQEYVEHVAIAVSEIVKTTKGRSFVLFTSQDMLKKTVEQIHATNCLEEYVVFAQGVTSGSKMKLLKSFQKFNKSVLFGTNSFWEGVDVPGDGLSSVIVVRLPFSSPDEPTFKLRSKALTLNGENAFQKLALPEAIIRLKQGFGRLIRSSGDKGVFVILDRRIETKSYGKQFIEAIPTKSVQKLSLDDVVTQIEHWYNKSR